jgi:hypothetical protein
VYALNNPLRYVDPDGLMEYDTKLMGKEIKVKISDNINKPQRDAIKANIDKAIAKINAGSDELTAEEKSVINRLEGIEVRNDIGYSFMNPESNVFNLTPALAQTTDIDWLAGIIIHESFHADQRERGLSFKGEQQFRTREKEASSFAAVVAEKVGLARDTVDAFKKDAITGHSPSRSGPYIKPPKKSP